MGALGCLCAIRTAASGDRDNKPSSLSLVSRVWWMAAARFGRRDVGPVSVVGRRWLHLSRALLVLGLLLVCVSFC